MLEHIADFTAWPILTGIFIGYIANRIMSGEGKGCCMNLFIGIVGSYAGAIISSLLNIELFGKGYLTIMTNKDLILASLMRAMIKYDGGDAPRIQHFVKVHDFARMIAIAEGMNEEDLFVLEAAAILHDVGIHVSQARYGNCDGKHQEELGPDEARKVLSEVDGFTAAQTERICWLIAHHHTYKDVTSLDHRILLEADFLVNSFEAHLAPEGIITFRDHVFRSESAISMLNDMWGLE